MKYRKKDTSQWLFLILLVSLVMPFALSGCGGADEPAGASNNADSEDDEWQTESSEGGLLGFHDHHELILEAEDAIVEAPMVVRIDDIDPRLSEIHKASGGKFVHLPPGNEQAAGGRIVFEFEVPQRRQYALWARVRWADSCSNTFRVVMNDGEPRTLGGDNTYNRWQWIRIPGSAGVFRLRAGSHRLELRNSEDNVSLDQILLTTDTDEQAQPQGILVP